MKVRYNRVFGYYIEVRRTHSDKVPEHYVRKQTLTNAERYFTEELKEFEDMKDTLVGRQRLEAMALHAIHSRRSADGSVRTHTSLSDKSQHDTTRTRY